MFYIFGLRPGHMPTWMNLTHDRGVAEQLVRAYQPTAMLNLKERVILCDSGAKLGVPPGQIARAVMTTDGKAMYFLPPEIRQIEIDGFWLSFGQ